MARRSQGIRNLPLKQCEVFVKVDKLKIQDPTVRMCLVEPGTGSTQSAFDPADFVNTTSNRPTLVIHSHPSSLTLSCLTKGD